VIGVGLNIKPQPTRELSSGYASLQELWPDASAPGALHRVAPTLARGLREFELGGFAAFVERYARRDLLAGHAVTTTAAELSAGVARGVAPDGSLKIETASGIQLLASGEVSVRLAGDAPAAEAAPRP
jgi:BirA family biotin operon repressor/biotin-[acetyl-CoA-carboxylase] ligase